MSEPLKPCPFCGGEARISDYKTEYDTDSFWAVECSNCYAKSDTRIYDEQSIEAWNTRADDKYNELVEFLISHILNGNSCGLTDDMCTKYEDMTFDLQDLLRKHGVEV